MHTETISPNNLFQHTRGEIDKILNGGKFLSRDSGEKILKIRKILLKFSKEVLEKLRECLYMLGLQLSPIYKTHVIVSIDERINAL